MANQNGSALLFVLLAVVILGLSASAAGSTWRTIDQRAREQELLWRGNQYRQALGSYYDGVGGGGLHQFPESLEELLQDNRSLATVRHLRRLYPDPITGGDWELIRDAKGRIKGVRSSSRLTPFQQDGFRPENKSFSGRQSYAAWEFIATPTAKKQKGKAPAPATPQRPAVAFPPMS